nr:hypothetical protein [uncultured Halomonas sp.]
MENLKFKDKKQLSRRLKTSGSVFTILALISTATQLSTNITEPIKLASALETTSMVNHANG